MKWIIEPAQSASEDRWIAWERIHRTDFSAHPLLDRRFVAPMVRHFGNDRTVFASLSGDDDSVQGALLLSKRRTGVWQTFLPSQAQIAPVALPAAHADTLDALMAVLPGRCWLLDLLKQDPEYSCLSKRPKRVEETPHALTIRVLVQGVFDEYWSMRTKNLKKNLRRYFRRLQSGGVPYTLQVLDEPSEVQAALVRYGKLESKGWKGAAGTAVRADNAQGAFYTDLLHGFASERGAFVYELRLSDHLTASQLCIANDKMLVLLKTTYDEELASYAPGRLLLYLLLKHEFERKRFSVIEFYTNAAKETLGWGSESRMISHLSLYRRPIFLTTARLWRRARLRRGSGQDISPNGHNDAREDARIQKHEGAAQNFVDKIGRYEDFTALKSEWDRCYELDGYSSFFLTHVWYENFIQEVVREGSELAIYLVRDEPGRIEAVFPMLASRASARRVWSRNLTFLANFYSPVAKPVWAVRDFGTRVRLARCFLRHLREVDTHWDVVDFSLLPEETEDFDVLQRALEEEGMAHTVYPSSVNWLLPTIGITAEEYTNRLPSRLRNTLRRRLRGAEKVERVELRLFRTVEEVTKHMDDYYQVYARSWKRPEPYPTFHRRLAEKLAARGEVVLGVAYFGGRPVAAQIWIIHRRVASILKLCFDDAYRKHSFGTILTHRLMSFVIDELHVTAVDYLTGDDAYKRDWMSVRRTRRGIMAFNRNARGRLLGLSEVKLKPALKRALRAVGRDDDLPGPGVEK